MGSVRYPSFPFHRAHPDRLAALLACFGVAPPPVAGARVLDLGCASAGHLLPMAHRLPGATFVGVDLDADEIALGQSRVDALGLTNVTLIAADLAALPADIGQFDYIVAHGLYSWLPAEGQTALLTLLRDRLVPTGAAYVSWNTLPGWYRRAPVRSFVQAFAGEGDSATRVERGRELLEELGGLVPERQAAWNRMILEELDRLDDAHDGFFSAEITGAHHEALEFTTFARRVRAEGLEVLADAEALNPALTGPLHPMVKAATGIVGTELDDVEQFVDTVEGRAFRASVLVHRDLELDRRVHGAPLRALRFGAHMTPPTDFTPGRPATFTSPWGGTARIATPLVQCTLDALSRRWPELLCFDEVVHDVGELIGRPLPEPMHEELAMLLRVCAGSNLVELGVRPMQPRRLPGDRPEACPVARVLAAEGSTRVANDVHRAVPLEEADHTLLPLLDGTRDRAALAEAVAAALDADDLEDANLPADPAAAVEAVLRRYTTWGLLVG
ncbi:MAG: hypothetical protein ACI8PZ_006445 [Myxococcota bacterium]